ncbi:MAG: CDP-glucose 4,6-dehydratase [Solirubrobacteraceae bacterium]|jgi:CDP-glucose 4,6-dehydratase|nr:CDP-glucose 4,6-dehydratase [Solirubrobacteraceae bacterium]
MAPPLVDPAFWRDRTVLLTGHTGFKGAWLSLWLQALGARVVGFAGGVPSAPSLYELARVADGLTEVAADIRDLGAVRNAFTRHEPELVIHMAAQPLVRRSFADPRSTYEINVLGTVNVLEAARATPSVRAVVNVTSDKCYANPPGREPRPFVETDPLGGHDPYSSSKACAELVVEAYRWSFPGSVLLASARAGNVIGGGDWGEDRLIPDIMRGALQGEPIAVRNPEAVRPWQHVLNPLSGYLRLAAALHGDAELQGGWNFGPQQDDARPVRWIADRLTELWPDELRWELDEGQHPREAHFLSLDSTKARDGLGWTPTWGLGDALQSIVAWYGALRDGEDMRAATLAQIESFTAATVRDQPASSAG